MRNNTTNIMKYDEILFRVPKKIERE